MPINVSIIIPCYNEERTIAPLLDALLAQTYPAKDMEVIIADGGSTDGTLPAIEAWQGAHPDLRIKVVENTKMTIPSALNTAIKASNGKMIVRLDAHSKPHHEYVARVVEALMEERGQNVGGVWDIRPGGESWIARSIAAAAGHPIGVGGARYRYTEQAGYVDTVPFAAFHRSLIDQVGLFDETLLTNEDYEFNTRIRQIGGRIWLDPKIRSEYYARSNLKALARQYWRYGYWKWQMLRRYPKTIRLRQALPPLFVLALIFLTLLAPFLTLARWFLIALLGLYLFILLLAGIQLAIKHKSPSFTLGVPLAIATMHMAWGAGFLWSSIHPPKSKTG